MEMGQSCQYCKKLIDVSSGTYVIIMNNHKGAIWCSFGCFQARQDAGDVEERIDISPKGANE